MVLYLLFLAPEPRYDPFLILSPGHKIEKMAISPDRSHSIFSIICPGDNFKKYFGWKIRSTFGHFFFDRLLQIFTCFLVWKNQFSYKALSDSLFPKYSAFSSLKMACKVTEIAAIDSQGRSFLMTRMWILPNIPSDYLWLNSLYQDNKYVNPTKYYIWLFVVKLPVSRQKVCESNQIFHLTIHG